MVCCPCTTPAWLRCATDGTPFPLRLEDCIEVEAWVASCVPCGIDLVAVLAPPLALVGSVECPATRLAA